jgi:hypothetical protein
LCPSVSGMDVDWNEELVSQLEWHWQHQLRPRLDGLTDEEYFWQPVPGCWSVRARADSTVAEPLGAGEFILEYSYPAPEPEPVTTIAWRLAHIIVGVFAARSGSHFGAPAADWDSFEYPGTAKEALDQLDQQYATWIAGVRGLGIAGLREPCGPAEGPFAEYSMAALVLHIHREVIHHGAEIALLRDLYLREEELGNGV